MVGVILKTLKFTQSMRLGFNHNSVRNSFQKLDNIVNEENPSDLDVYTAIGELLLWVVTSDEWHTKYGLSDYVSRRNQDEDGAILLGMRHAFNMLKHNMDFFQIHRKDGGLEFSLEFPIEFEKITLKWMLAGDILNGIHENQKGNYIKYLEGEEIIDTFRKVVTFLSGEYSRIKFN